jgi:D-alanyl-D-alanine carboxypeptidase
MNRGHRRAIWIGLALLLALAAIASGCGGDGSSAEPVAVEVPTEAMSDADAASVDATVAKIWEANKTDVPTLYVGVWDPEKGVFTKAYGESAKGIAATTDDSFRIGSISKTFTAIVVLQLVEDGKLALDDTIQDVAPEVAKRYPTVADRTIEQLLRMQSGISDYINPEQGVVKDVVADPERVWSPDELIGRGIELGVSAPGAPGGYSTTNYILLQEIAEEITGASLADLIKSDVTDRLGMEKTYLPPNDDTTLPDPALHSAVTPSCRSEFTDSGGEIELGTDLTDWNASYGQGGGGMTSTLGDLGTWAASGTGDVLLSEDLATQRNDMSPLRDGFYYGLGVLRFGGWHGHEGEALGWEALALKDTDSGVTIALAGNSCGIFGQLVSVIQALYPEIPLQDEAP